MNNILAIDFGERFLGLALRTTKTSIPIPLKVIDVKKEALNKTIKNIIFEYEINLLVVGYPIGLNNSENRMTNLVNEFIEDISKFNIPIFKVNHIKDAIYHFKSLGISIVSASEKADKNLYDTDFKKPVAIVIGSENKGINKSVLKISDEIVKLPVYGKIESLNVSVASGIFLYEAIRQRI